MKSCLALVFLWFTTAPTLSWAEGILTFTCRATATCAPDGACVDGDRQVAFVTKPVNVGPSGEGTYTITYDGATYAMRNIDGPGPLLWSEGPRDAQILLLTSETTLLWQHQNRNTGASDLTFLTCEVS